MEISEVSSSILPECNICKREKFCRKESHPAEKTIKVALPQISIPASNAQSIKLIANVRFKARDSVQKIFSIRCLFLRCFYDVNAIV